MIVGNKELSEPYFLQTTLNDNDFYYAAACLMNENTTCVGFSKNNKCRKGISISIFPLDGFHQNYKLQRFRFQCTRINNVIAHAYVYNNNPSYISKIINTILHLPFVPYNKNKVFLRVNKIAKKTKWSDTDKVGTMVYGYPSWFRSYQKADFEKTIYMPFEYIQVPVPSGYDRIFRGIYKDYMRLPPVEKRQPKHDETFYTEMPYKVFFDSSYNIN